MAVAPNHQKLIVPGKNSQGGNAGYATDMRTIEQWANEGIVRKLIAGSGITLDPSSGVDAGQGIEITSSGGGGSTPPGFLKLISGPDGAELLATALIFGPSDPGHPDTSWWQLFSNPGAFIVDQTIGSGWFVAANGGESASILPEVDTPAFTGGSGTIGFDLVIAAAALDYSNYLIAESSSVLVGPSTHYQFLDTDFSVLSSGPGDFALTAGSGESGNGIVTAGGVIALGCMYGTVSIPAGTTFT